MKIAMNTLPKADGLAGVPRQRSDLVRRVALVTTGQKRKA